jgi:hypothetical protein
VRHRRSILRPLPLSVWPSCPEVLGPSAMRADAASCRMIPLPNTLAAVTVMVCGAWVAGGDG